MALEHSTYNIDYQFNTDKNQSLSLRSTTRVFRIQPQGHYSENHRMSLLRPGVIEQHYTILLDRDFQNSAPGLYTENSGMHSPSMN